MNIRPPNEAQFLTFLAGTAKIVGPPFVLVIRSHRDSISNFIETLWATAEDEIVTLHLTLIVLQEDSVFEEKFDAGVAELFADHEVVWLTIDPDDVTDIIDATPIMADDSFFQNPAIAINSLIVFPELIGLLLFIIKSVARLAVVALDIFVHQSCHSPKRQQFDFVGGKFHESIFTRTS